VTLTEEIEIAIKEGYKTTEFYTEPSLKAMLSSNGLTRVDHSKKSIIRRCEYCGTEHPLSPEFFGTGLKKSPVIKDGKLVGGLSLTCLHCLEREGTHKPSIAKAKALTKELHKLYHQEEPLPDPKPQYIRQAKGTYNKEEFLDAVSNVQYQEQRMYRGLRFSDLYAVFVKLEYDPKPNVMANILGVPVSEVLAWAKATGITFNIK
jgi:hypothetical protein